jgi:iron complex outermembrane receptor protein
LGKAENSGYEVRYNYRSSDGTIEGYLGFTFVDAVNKNQQSENDPAYRKQLPYVPKSIGTFGVSFETEVGRINLYHLITSLRYTDTQNSISLPAYELTNVNLENKLMFRELQITMRCAVNNVFDVDYQVVEGYPMHGRSYKISISMEY